jgi:hypothetical protein
MVFRILGAVSLGIGGIFVLITLLTLLPFIDNFSTSLLVLAGVFGVLAYVFLAIGWQLFHPPSGQRVMRRRAVVESDETFTSETAAEGAGVGAVAEAEGESEMVSEAEVAGSSEAESAAAAAGTADEGQEGSPNGAGADQAHVTTGSGFKKPGAPVPHK